MQIIPVADIKNGQVVQAIKGDRSHYKPIQSNLCSSSAPSEVINALLRSTQANIIYLADLDAIENSEQASENNFLTIEKLARQYPDQTFWVDAGFDSQNKLNSWTRIPNLRPVIGTESHTEISSLLQVLNPDSILSLDFKNDQLVGPKETLDRVENWPDDVIIMSLNSVGSHSGPDLNLITEIQTLNPDTRFYAAGGIRDRSDLDLLIPLGVEGVLIATALHNQNFLNLNSG